MIRSVRGFWSLLPALALGILAGCGGESTETPPAETGAEQGGAAVIGPDSAAAAGSTGGRLTATLEPVDESGVEGQATALTATDSVQLNLMVQGLPSEGEYGAQVHKGSCETGGPLAFSLTPVRSDRDGLGRSTTSLPPDSFVPEEHYFVQVQQGSKPLACGDVQGR